MPASEDSASEEEVPRPKKSTSTLADGNHAVPPFYACYLLRSRATPRTQRTYVGCGLETEAGADNRSALLLIHLVASGSTMAS